MKRLSDYKDEAAFDLLADILEPVSVILADKELSKIWNTQPKVQVAKHILKNHQQETIEVLKAIDNEIEITPISIIKGAIEILTDIEKDPSIKDFFKSAEQETEENGTFGSATENTEDGEN